MKRMLRPVTEYVEPEFPQVASAGEIEEADCSNYDLCRYVTVWCSPGWFQWRREWRGCFCEDSRCECGNNGAAWPWQ